MKLTDDENIRKFIKQRAKASGASITRVDGSVYSHMQAVLIAEIDRMIEQCRTQKTAKPPMSKETLASMGLGPRRIRK